MMTEAQEREYILFDARACGQPIGGAWLTRAIVLDTCDSLAEAKKLKGDFGQMACWSYIKGIEDPHSDHGERWEFDYND